MSGSYSKRVRQWENIPIPFMNGFIGEPGGLVPRHFNTDPARQETYSYRTVRESGPDLSDLSVQADVTRNGFRTYDPSFDKGHEFWSTKVSSRLVSPEVYLRMDKQDGSRPQFFRGQLMPKIDTAGGDSGAYYPGIPHAMTSSEVAVLGQRAVNNTAPTAPQASVATLIGELLGEGLPAMIASGLLKSKLKDYREVGGEYLNVQFGWLPFLSELRGIVSSYQKATRALQQLQRDNGRNVRRRFAFPTQVTNASSSFEGVYGPYKGSVPSSDWLERSSGTVTVTDRSESSSWFSGCYTYHLPADDSLMGKLALYEAQANVLFGSRVNPEVVWQLSPWSWLIDWHFAIGQALGAATRLSEDSLVIRYGYLMRHSVTTRTFSVPGNRTKGFHDILPPVFFELRSERKERVRATPYGFGLSTAAFTDTRWAILAALGMTMGPKIVRA